MSSAKGNSKNRISSGKGRPTAQRWLRKPLNDLNEWNLCWFPEKNYHTHRTDVHYNDDTWSMSLLDSIEFGRKIMKVFSSTRFFPILVGHFSWKIKCTNSRRVTGNIFTVSKRKPNLIETDGGKDFVKKNFWYFLYLKE